MALPPVTIPRTPVTKHQRTTCPVSVQSIQTTIIYALVTNSFQCQGNRPARKGITAGNGKRELPVGAGRGRCGFYESKPIVRPKDLDSGNLAAAVPLGCDGQLTDAVDMGEADAEQVLFHLADNFADEPAGDGYREAVQAGGVKDGLAFCGTNPIPGGELSDLGLPVLLFLPGPVGGLGQDLLNFRIPIGFERREELVADAVAIEAEFGVGGVLTPGKGVFGKVLLDFRAGHLQ